MPLCIPPTNSGHSTFTVQQFVFPLLTSNILCQNIRFLYAIAESDESRLDQYCCAQFKQLWVVIEVPRVCDLVISKKKKKN